MKNTNTIVIPYNFSKEADYALEESYNLAKETDSKVVVAHVVEKNSFFNALDITQQNLVCEGLENKLKEVVKRESDKTGINIEAVIRRGRVFSEVDKLTKEKGARWIIAGLNNAKENEKNYIGTNTLRFLKSLDVPIITVFKGCEYKMYNNILLPLDLSGETSQKTNYAIDMAKTFDSTIHIVSGTYAKGEAIDRRMLAKTEQVVRVIKSHGVKVKVGMIKTVNGKKIVDEVLKYADTNEIDLIVIMSQQEINIVNFFIGSNAQQFIRKSKVPVMTIKPKQLGTLMW